MNAYYQDLTAIHEACHNHWAQERASRQAFPAFTPPQDLFGAVAGCPQRFQVTSIHQQTARGRRRLDHPDHKQDRRRGHGNQFLAVLVCFLSINGFGPYLQVLYWQHRATSLAPFRPIVGPFRDPTLSHTFLAC